MAMKVTAQALCDDRICNRPYSLHTLRTEIRGKSFVATFECGSSHSWMDVEFLMSESVPTVAICITVVLLSQGFPIAFTSFRWADF